MMLVTQKSAKKSRNWTRYSTITAIQSRAYRPQKKANETQKKKKKKTRPRTHFMCDSSIIKHLVLLLLNNIKFNTI